MGKKQRIYCVNIYYVDYDCTQKHTEKQKNVVQQINICFVDKKVHRIES